MEKLQLDVALKCFKCPFFEKRMYGLNYINEVVTLIYPHTESSKERREVDHGPSSGALVVYGASQPFRSTRWITAS